RMRIKRPEAYRRLLGMPGMRVDISTTMPITMEPASAPNAVPMPPRVTEANMRSSRIMPRVHVKDPNEMASSMPDRPARPVDMIHTMRTMRSGLMPVAAASAALSDTARVAWPMRVCVRNHAMARMTTTATAIEIQDAVL